MPLAYKTFSDFWITKKTFSPGNRDQRQRSRRQEDLQVFRQQDELDISQISNVHVNPAAHYDILKRAKSSKKQS